MPLKETVHPFASRDATTSHPARLGKAEVPSLIPSVPLLCPAVSMETRMLSTLVWLRAQFCQALVKFVARQLSNIPCGNVVRLVQFCQAELKKVPLLTSSKGKEVRLSQSCQAELKKVPLLTSSRGKEVRLVQLCQALSKLVPLLTLSKGKEVKLEQACQA